MSHLKWLISNSIGILFEHQIKAKQVAWNAFKVFISSLPAGTAWLIIALLKGQAYSCAYWPDAGVQCPGTNQTYPLPCQAPNTLGTALNTCEAIMARDLVSESHMIGWMIIMGKFLFTYKITFIKKFVSC